MPTESFFSDSSFAFISSTAAGKDGTSYSMKPTDRSGDYTFTRGSNTTATRVGPDGLIEKGRENLLFYSNAFDSLWTQSSVDREQGVEGYDGTNDAWTLTISGGTDYQRIQQQILNAEQGVYTFSVYVKRPVNEPQWVALRLFTSASDYTGYYYLGTGESETNTFVEYTKEDVGNGWWRISGTGIGVPTNARIYFAPQDSSQSQTSGIMYIQDAQLELSLCPTSYMHNIGSILKYGITEHEPRYDYKNELNGQSPLIAPYLLLEDSSTNLQNFSEFFKNTIFTRGFIQQNKDISPEGFQNASRLVLSTENGGHVLIPTYFSAISGTDYTISIFAKRGPDNYKNIRLQIVQGGGTIIGFEYADFNLETGVASGESVDTKCSIEPFKDGWYRCIVTGRVNVTANNIRVNLTVLNQDGIKNFPGDNVGYVSIYGLQIEKQSFASSYIPNQGLSAGAGRLAELSRLDTGYDKNNDLTFFLEFNTELQKAEATESKNYFNLGYQQRFMGRVANYAVNPNDIRNWWRMYDVNRYLGADSNSVAKWCFIKQGLNIKVYTQGTLAYDITQELSDNQNLIFELLIGKYKKILVYNTAISEEDAIELTTL